MSKSLGNSPDPIELMRKYGADGVRVGMLLCSPAGGDLLFDESLPEQGRNFGNKIWNAFRLVSGWKAAGNEDQPRAAGEAVAWFRAKLNESKEKLNDQFGFYRLSEALMTVYRLFWDEFSSWYLEAVKPAYGQPIDRKTLEQTIGFFEELLLLLHPFMPFITEEIWQLIRPRKKGESIMMASWPERKAYDGSLTERFEKTKEAIATLRSIRKEKNIQPKEQLRLLILDTEEHFDNRFLSVLKKLGNLREIEFVSEKPENALSFIVKTTEYFIPFEEKIDVAGEIEKLKTELKYARGFLNTVMKKLGNERFISNAPAQVVERERQKQSDAEARIKAMEERLKELQGRE